MTAAWYYDGNMRLLIAAAVLGTLGILPVYAYDQLVQPQLDALEGMYGSMDQTAQDIAEGKDLETTETYKNAEVLSSGWQTNR